MDPPIIYTEPHHTALLPQLARLIPLCTTHHNTSLGFLPPFSHDKLLRFWKSQVADPERTIILQLRNPSSDAENPEQLEGPAGEAKSNENSEKEVIGCIVVVRKHKETGMFRGYMEKLMVKPEYMGKGVGRRLVERAEEEIWKGNGKMVHLSTQTDTPAEGFYQKLGYLKYGEIPKWVMRPMDRVRVGVSFFYKDLEEGSSTIFWEV